jgi:hypothetical protein
MPFSYFTALYSRAQDIHKGKKCDEASFVASCANCHERLETTEVCPTAHRGNIADFFCGLFLPGA